MYILSFSHDPNVIYHHDVNILSSFLIEYFVFLMRSLHEICRAKYDFLSAFNYECTISLYYKLANIQYAIYDMMGHNNRVVNMIVIWSNMLIIQSVTSFYLFVALFSIWESSIAHGLISLIIVMIHNLIHAAKIFQVQILDLKGKR